MMTAYYLNDLGIINALGNDKISVVTALLSGKSGLNDRVNLISGRSTLVGRVDHTLPAMPAHLSVYDCRNNQMLIVACNQIMPSIEKMIHIYGRDRVAIVLGTSTSGIDNGEKAFQAKKSEGDFPSAFDYRQQEIGAMSDFLKAYLGIEGIAYTLSTACSSSGKTFACAQRLLEHSLCDAVIVGGCDTLCELTYNGFDCLESVSENNCRPFDHQRDGINIGEGAALFVLSKQPSEIALLGYGESSDGYHITSPEPNGEGAQAVMRQALAMAKLSPNDIGYLNLHGTATPKNDEMESHAVKQLFPQGVDCSSTKALTGHTLGAAAATELGLCWLMLHPDYNSQQHLVRQYPNEMKQQLMSDIQLVSTEKSWDKAFFMSNSFAFGGSNVSLVIGRAL